MKLNKLIRLPDYVTLLNAISGLLSIFCAIIGRLDFAALLLFLAVVFDFLDGKVARLTKTESEFGKQIDSLADIVSFGIAPAVFAFVIESSLLGMLIYILFVSAGILRLARHNITKTKGFYEGIPITFSGIFIPILYILKVPSIVYPIAMSIHIVLMISSFKLKKVV